MILADTSVWVRHLRDGDRQLADALQDNRVVCHPFIVAELALGSLRNRTLVLGLLDALPQAPIADAMELRQMIERRAVYGRGIGYVDAHLLASTLLEGGLRLLTKSLSD
ncbi:MAG: type II toxin-antitoxin system VapC family toxin [Sphingomonadales bacterium]|nr:MAG: type II toxin-antitoxin system VapC family toxin [Sphingomonadales bacterium]